MSESVQWTWRIAIAWRTALLLKRMKSLSSAASQETIDLARACASASRCAARSWKYCFIAVASEHVDAARTCTRATRGRTRITCEGSPLPQNGVPITSNVDASPTPESERQNVAETPR